MKAVELFLIDRKIPYNTGQTRLYVGQELRVLPIFSLTDENTEIELTVLDTRDLRATLRSSREGRIIERVRLPALEAMLG